MEKISPIFPSRKWAALITIGAVALILSLTFSVCTITAQEQTPAKAQPAAEVKPTEEAKPAQPAKPTEEAKPAEAVKPAPEAKPAETAKPAVATKPEPKAEAPKEPEPKAKPEAEEEEPEEISNDTCLGCHNPDILEASKEDLAEMVEMGDKPLPPKKKPIFLFGKLGLAIDEDKYGKGVHGETTCVECHTDVEDDPHPQRLNPVDCKECHEEAVDSILASAHGKKAGPKAPGCIGCHDVHYGKGSAEYADQWKEKMCVKCHGKSGLDTVAVHDHLYEAKLHMTMGCVMCHKGEEEGVHNIPVVKTKVAQCESCHSKYSILSTVKRERLSLVDYFQLAWFINNDSRKKYGYVVGSHRIPLLDLIIILAVLAPLALPVFHGGLRVLTRRKGPIELPEEKILLHPLTERLWHWGQAICIVMLIITGAMIHWPEKFPTWFDWAVGWHNWFGIAAVVMFLVWLIYNLATRRMSHYFLNKEEIRHGMLAQAKFYGYGIFKHEPHPYAPTEDNKFNPLQKFAYLQFQVMLLPLLLISGILYMYPMHLRWIIDAIGGMTVLATIHYILGALFAAFLVAHLYLATTGETVGENFKAMIFGYGIKEDHGEHK